MYLACAIYMYCVSTSFGIYVKTTILIVYSVTITYEYVRVQPFHFIHCNCSLRFMCLSTFFLFFLVFPDDSRYCCCSTLSTEIIFHLFLHLIDSKYKKLNHCLFTLYYIYLYQVNFFHHRYLQFELNLFASATT